LALFVFQQKNYGRTEMFSKGKWIDMGHNFHMTEMQAVVGTVMAETMEKRIKQRQDLHKFGYGALHEEGLSALGNWSGRPNLYKFMIRLPKGVKSDFTDHLQSHDIGLSTALYDFVTPHLEVWGGVWDGKEFPKAQAHAEEHVCLPMHNLLTTSDAQWVTGVVNRYFE
jgi:dTDP-4-amino-4,6-dideoxygalactose transaminase